MASSFAAIKVALIQTTPYTDTNAVAMDRKRLLFTICSGFALVNNMMRAAADNETMEMMVTIFSVPSAFTMVLALPSTMLGTISGKEPPSTIIRMANPKMTTESLASLEISFF